MADFASDKRTASFEEWFEQVELLCELNYAPAGDRNDWLEHYKAGLAVDAAVDKMFGGDLYGE